MLDPRLQASVSAGARLRGRGIWRAGPSSAHMDLRMIQETIFKKLY